MGTVTPATEESIKLWLKVGNLRKLEQAVLDGYGDQLRGRNSRIPKINKFLKRVPHYQAKIAAIHSAAAQGNVRDLANLLDRKGLVYGRDGIGATPLHTAVLHNQIDAVKYLLENFKSLLHARDHYGRTALHYAAALQSNSDVYELLQKIDADVQLKDMAGKTPQDYASNPQDFQLNPPPGTILSNPASRRQSREVSSILRYPSPLLPMTRSEVRSIIQKGDVTKLEHAILQGSGERLLGETAISSRVRNLLESVPQHLNKLAALQVAIENGSLRDVQNLLNRKSLVLARDKEGLSVLHKAVLNGQKDIVEYLVSVNPKGIFAKDHDKRTPVHYAAALEDNGEIYNLLMEAGGNTSTPDCDGKTPEYYRQNPASLDLKKALERRSEGSGKLSTSTTTEYQPKITKSGKREVTSSQVPTGNSNNIIKQWLRSGDIDKLEKAVIEGHGLRLLRETTSDPRARAFLRTVPAYMAKINSIHDAVCQGELRNIKLSLDRKKLAMSRDQLGLGLLQKAVLFQHNDIVKFLLENYPEIKNIKDKTGRTALHYAAAMKNNQEIYDMLIAAGADTTLRDMKGNTAEHYKKEEGGELDVTEILNRVNRQRSRQNNAAKQITAKPQETTFSITGGNIRKWIHAEDIKKLQKVVLEGQGYKLLLETSNNPKVKQFLVSVPALVTKIRDVHNAVVSGDIQGVESSIEKPIILLGKDELGMTPLHKAVLLEREELVQFIVSTVPASLKVTDEDGRTALHYAAGMKDDGKTYNMLVKAGSDPQATDNRGKSAEHYLKHPGELDMRHLQAHIQRSKPTAKGKQETHNNNNNNVKRQSVAPNLRPVRKAANSAVNNENITKMIQQGDLEKLEQIVLDGHGKRLVGKSSWNEDVRVFLKKITQYMDKIYAIHTAAATGDLLVLQQLLDKKKMVMAKDEYGLTALHKAVKYGQTDVVKYLLQTFPASHLVKDQDGRTPLHYAGLYKNRNEIYDILVSRGADPKIKDQKGKSPEYYSEHHSKLDAPTPPKALEKLQQENAQDKTEDEITALEEDRHIENCLKFGDLEPLEKLVLAGHGDKLLGKSSNDIKTQEFLENVPAEMGKIRAIHNAAAYGDMKDLPALIDNDVLAVALDEHGACPLHRAVLHEHKDVMKFLANNYPACLNLQDKSGLTPLHYAAIIGSDGLLYRLLSNCGADPNLKDKSGKTPGQVLRGNASVTLEELYKRYEEKKVPPRPHSVQTWERPPTEELLRALTPSPKTSSSEQAENFETNEDEDEEKLAEFSQDEIEKNEEENDVAEREENESSYTSTAKDTDRPDVEEKELEDEEADDEASKSGINDVPEDEINSTVTKSEPVENAEDAEDEIVHSGKQTPTADDFNAEAVIRENGESNTIPLTDIEEEVLRENNSENDNREETDTREVNEGAEKKNDSSENAETYEELDNPEKDLQEPGKDLQEPGKDLQEAGKDLQEAGKDLQEAGKDLQEAEKDLQEAGKELLEPEKHLPEPEKELLGSEKELQEPENADIKDDAEEFGATATSESSTEIDEDKSSGTVVDSEGDVSTGSSDIITGTSSSSPQTNDNETQESSATSNDTDTNSDKISMESNPMTWTKEGEYLTTVLGDALINALAEVSRMRPGDPITYLSLLLYRYLHLNEIKKEQTNNGMLKPSSQTVNSISKCRLLFDEDGIVDITKLCEMKGSDGSTVVHYVARKDHERDCFFELLCQTNYNLGERDGSYRTIRDVAYENKLHQNVEAIDRYVFYLVREGKEDILTAITLCGYDRLLEILDDEGNDPIMVAELNQQLQIAKLLKGYKGFQEKVELLHESVRNKLGIVEVRSILLSDNDLGLAKNTKGQTALHVAVLTENEEIVELIANECPSATNVADNMGRTPLHYAMGTENPETFAKIIVKNGGNQLLRDCVMHTPSYYFINNADIQRLKDEMEEITV